MPISKLDTTSRLMDAYVCNAIKFAQASRRGRESGNKEQEVVAMQISARYMNKVKTLQASLAEW